MVLGEAVKLNAAGVGGGCQHAEVLVALRALGAALISHCRFNWQQIDGWKIRPLPCRHCRTLAEALGIELDSLTATCPDRPT